MPSSCSPAQARAEGEKKTHHRPRLRTCLRAGSQGGPRASQGAAQEGCCVGEEPPFLDWAAITAGRLRARLGFLSPSQGRAGVSPPPRGGKEEGRRLPGAPTRGPAAQGAARPGARGRQGRADFVADAWAAARRPPRLHPRRFRGRPAPRGERQLRRRPRKPPQQRWRTGAPSRRLPVLPPDAPDPRLPARPTPLLSPSSFSSFRGGN